MGYYSRESNLRLTGILAFRLKWPGRVGGLTFSLFSMALTPYGWQWIDFNRRQKQKKNVRERAFSSRRQKPFWFFHSKVPFSTDRLTPQTCECPSLRNHSHVGIVEPFGFPAPHIGVTLELKVSTALKCISHQSCARSKSFKTVGITAIVENKSQSSSGNGS